MIFAGGLPARLAGAAGRDPVARAAAALLSRSTAIGQLRVVPVLAGDQTDALREIADLLDQLADPTALQRRLAGAGCGNRRRLAGASYPKAFKGRRICRPLASHR